VQRRTHSRLSSRLWPGILLALGLLVGAPALGVDGPANNFELDGDPNDGADPGDDWSMLIGGGGAALARSAVPVADPAPVSVFVGGGSKDVRDIPHWAYGSGSVPDKDNITNAFAAAYENGAGELVIHFGADRFANDGDAQLAFWFFQNEVKLAGGGSFEGVHALGDVLVLVNFVNGGTTPQIQVLEWVGSGGSEKLGTLDTVVPLGSALCNGSGGKAVCAITNPGGETVPWSYAPKAGVPGIYPPQSFFEGAININQVFGEARCFASFLAETRSSSSATAVLKDFVIGTFPVCRMEISKVCGTATYDPAWDAIVADYSVTVRNTGFATVDSVVVTENGCTAGSDDDRVEDVGPIAPGAAAVMNGRCVVDDADLNTGNASLTPLVNQASAVAEGGEIAVASAATCLAGGPAGSCRVVCPVSLSPRLAVSKSCRTRLSAEDGAVKVLVDFGGDVCNTSNETASPAPLQSVQVRDDSGTPDDLSDDQTLELYDGTGNPLGTSISLGPGRCAYFDQSYAPGSVNSECPSRAEFSDTVRASGRDRYLGGTASAVASATCRLCDEAGCGEL
jgi:hypothetical protein